MSLRKLFYFLPARMRYMVRKLFYFPHQLFEKSKYENGISVPPKSLIFTGGGDFVKTGFRFLALFKKYGNIEPSNRILDIGSGIGRIAIPLTHYMDDQGSYDGIDIMPIGVKWCDENISSRFPNFNFHLKEFKNDLYRDSGLDPREFKLDFSANYFDFTCLISVFTHMLPEEIEQYLKEINRTLKFGSSCLITFFIFEDDLELTSNQFVKFIKQDDNYALMSKKVKGANVAYSYDYLRDLIAGNNFDLIYYSKGGWKGNEDSEDFQDFLVITKNQ